MFELRCSSGATAGAGLLVAAAASNILMRSIAAARHVAICCESLRLDSLALLPNLDQQIKIWTMNQKKIEDV